MVRVHRGERDEVERRREHRAGGEAEAVGEPLYAVINCAGLACANHHPHAFRYLKLNLQDTAREDISAAFYDALDFIDAAIGAPAAANGCVFVHCQHGVSRSATIVIAYLMWRQRVGYDEALPVRDCAEATDKAAEPPASPMETVVGAIQLAFSPLASLGRSMSSLFSGETEE